MTRLASAGRLGHNRRMPYRRDDRRSLTDHRRAWAVSLTVHLAAAAVACGFTPSWVDRAPELIGQTSRVELLATMADDEFSSPQRAAAAAEEPIRITPTEVEVARRRFRTATTDVSNPTPSELARVDRLLRDAPSPSRRAHAHRPQAQPPSDAAPAAIERRTLPSQQAVRVTAGSPRPGTVDRPMPELLDNPPPEYPLSAIERRVEGTVLLRVHVGRAGAVARVEIVRSSGHRVLDGEAVRAVRHWRFVPATRGGTPIVTAVLLPVRFELANLSS